MKKWKKWLAAGICCLCPWTAWCCRCPGPRCTYADSIRRLARSGNINLVVDDSVQGSLTMNLHDVTLEEALQLLPTVRGCTTKKRAHPDDDRS